VRASGDDVDGGETNIEVTYRAALTDWLTLQPNVQYVINPGTNPALDDDLLIGLRFETGYGFTF
jgi:porin